MPIKFVGGMSELKPAWLLTLNSQTEVAPWDSLIPLD